ncbi:MAG: MFS transporter [Candidatus Kariarchaeaceae archaeon]
MTSSQIDQTIIEAKKTDRRNILLWSSYDAGDTLFSQAIISLAFQPLVLLVAFDQGIDSYKDAFLYMSLFMAFSNLLVALLGPLIGAISDTSGSRKPFVIFSATLMMLSTYGMMFFNDFVILCLLFVLANFSYQAGRMFFDSMIPFLAKTEERGTASAISGSLAFFGTFGAIGLGKLAYALYGEPSAPSNVFLDPSNPDYEVLDYGGIIEFIGFSVLAILLFTIPFLFSKEKVIKNGNGIKKNVRIALKDFRVTFSELLNDRNALLFIITWFFVTDASNATVLYMNAVIVDGAGATMGEALIVIAMGGLLAMIGAILTGVYLDRFGPKKIFKFNIYAWGISVILAILACWEPNGNDIFPWQIMILSAFSIGIGFGGLWIIGRQFIYEIAPPSKVAAYMGFKQISGRVSAIISPILFAGGVLLGDFLGYSESNSFALALIPLFIFFIIGYFFLRNYVDVHEEYLAGERAPYAKFAKTD